MPKRKLTKQAGDVEVAARVASTRISRSNAVASATLDATEAPGGRSSSKRRKLRAKEEEKGAPNHEEAVKSSSEGIRTGSRKKGVKVETGVEEEIEKVHATKSDQTSPAKRKRKTKEEKQAETMPLAARTVGHKLFIGAHVSSAGGVQNSVGNSVHIGANAFALFLKSQRKWANPPLIDDQCSAFHDNCGHHSYDQSKHVVPHGSYLVNLACTDKARSDQAFESYLDDLKRCEKLGIKLYNIHPGNTLANDRPTAIGHLAMHINKAHKETSTVVTLLENMAAGGNVLGSTFEDLRDIIALVDDKTRVGVCIDTCHSFAAGYDLRSPEAFQATMSRFEETVGFKYLRALHMNDSKAPLGAHRDLHANIGTGFLGLRAFHNFVNDVRFEGLPLVLETPIDAKDENGVPLKDEKGKVKEDKGIWANEIKLLENLVGMDISGDEFMALEKQLARRGEPERKRLADQLGRKREKEDKKAKSPRKSKGKKAQLPAEEDSSLSELDEED